MPYSYIDSTGNGANTSFSVPFPFITRSHVTVEVNGVNTAFTWVTDGSITVSPAPPDGSVVRIKRTTPKYPLVTYVDGVVDRAKDRNTANLQAIYLTQEYLDLEAGGLRIPAGDTVSDALTTLPSDRALKFLAFDADKKPIAAVGVGATPVIPSIASALTQPTLADARAALGPWGDALVTATGGATARDLQSRFADVVNVKDYGAIGDGATDDTSAIQLAVARIQAIGGGTLLFPPGVYSVFGSTSGTLCAITGCAGVRCIGYGATLRVPLSKAITSSEGHFFLFNGCSNIEVAGFATDGPTLDVAQTAVKGYEFVRCVNGCRGVHLTNNTVRNSLAGFITSKLVGDSDSLRTQNITIDNLTVVNCWYGINCQYSGDGLRVRNLRTDTIHRSCFIYGASNIDVEIWSKDHKSVDVPVTTSQGVACENVRIAYHSAADSVSCGNACKVCIGFSGQTASVMRNVRVELDVVYASAGSTGGPALVIRKVDNAGGSDLADRGHRLDGFDASGAITGQGSYLGDYGSATICTDNSCVWGGGDYFNRMVLHDLTLAPTSTAGVPWLILGGLQDLLALRDVICSRSIAIRNTSADQRPPRIGRMILDGVQCANRCAYDATDALPPLDYLRAVGASPDPVPVGWSGRVITNDGMGGAMVWNLPAAVRGLSYTFIRTEPQNLQVAPTGAELIRGGTSGQKLVMNTLGNRITLECLITGVWDISSSVGALGYV